MVEIDLVRLLGFLGAGAVAAYFVVKYRLKQLIHAVEEYLEVLKAIDAAIEDDKVSEDEFRLIWAEAKEFVQAIRDIIYPNRA